MAKITAYEYLSNEFEGAKKKAQTLSSPEDRQLFADHADMIYSRMMAMSPEEASRVMFEDDGKPEQSKIVRKIRITIQDSYLIETSEHTVNTLRCDDALGGQVAKKLALVVGKRDHEFSRVIIKDARK